MPLHAQEDGLSHPTGEEGEDVVEDSDAEDIQVGASMLCSAGLLLSNKSYDITMEANMVLSCQLPVSW